MRGWKLVAAAALWWAWADIPAAAAADVPAATAVISGFLLNTAHWFQYLASVVAVASIAYGGLRLAVATSPRAQAEAWRVVLAGIGGLLLALLAPTIVAVVSGLVPAGA